MRIRERTFLTLRVQGRIGIGAKSTDEPALELKTLFFFSIRRMGAAANWPNQRSFSFFVFLLVTSHERNPFYQLAPRTYRFTRVIATIGPPIVALATPSV